MRKADEKREQMKDQLARAIMEATNNVWPMVVNEQNDGNSVFLDMHTGKPIDGRYRGTYARNARKLVSEAGRIDSREVEFQLASFLSELVWVTDKILNGPKVSRKTSQLLLDCDKLSRKEKVRQCNIMLDFLDAWSDRMGTLGRFSKPPMRMYYHPIHTDEYRAG